MEKEGVLPCSVPRKPCRKTNYSSRAHRAGSYSLLNGILRNLFPFTVVISSHRNSLLCTSVLWLYIQECSAEKRWNYQDYWEITEFLCRQSWILAWFLTLCVGIHDPSLPNWTAVTGLLKSTVVLPQTAPQPRGKYFIVVGKEIAVNTCPYLKKKKDGKKKKEKKEEKNFPPAKNPQVSWMALKQLLEVNK